MLNKIPVYKTGHTAHMVTSPDALATVNAEPCPVYYLEAMHSPASERESFSDFDKLLLELEQDEETAAQLQEGRKWVASEFYQERPTLASLRLSAGLSQKQLGAACGMEQPHVSRYESGKHEPLLTVSMNMARALGVDLDVFAQAWANTREYHEKECAK